MDAAQHLLLDRRLFQKLCLTVPVPLALGVFGGRTGFEAALAQSDDDAIPDPREEILLPSPSCEDDDDATDEQT